MKIDKLNRRVFLQGAGALMVAIPALPSLMNKAYGATTPLNKRFFTMTTRNQLSPTRIYNVPDGLLTNHGKYRSMAIGNQLTTICPILSDPAFAGLASQLSLIQGLNLGDLDHHWSAILGNMAGGMMTSDGWQKPFDWCLPEPTIDWVMAKFSGIPVDRIYRATTTGGKSFSSEGATGYMQWWQTAGANTLYNGNPYLIFQNYFTNVNTIPKSSLKAKRKIIDSLLEDIRTNIRGKSFISSSDRVLLDNHLDYMNDLENAYINGTASIPTSSCSVGANGNINMNATTTPASLTDYRKFLSDHVNLMAEGIKCNVFKLGSFGITAVIGKDDQGNDIWWSHDGGDRKWHLELAHSDDWPKLLQANKFALDNVFKELIVKLNVEEENGNTFLDNSIIAFSPEHSDGHSQPMMPLILAGKGGGTIEAGRYWDFGDPNKRVADFTVPGTTTKRNIYLSTPYNRYWNGIVQSWGMKPSDYERPGRAGYGNHNHFELNSRKGMMWAEMNKDLTGYFSDVGTPLPGLFKIPA